MRYRRLVVSTLAILAMISGVNLGRGIPAEPDEFAWTLHAPDIDSGRVEGSLWLLSGENVKIGGSSIIAGDLLVPGTPEVKKSGNASFVGIVQGTGSPQPTGYEVSLSGHTTLRNIVTRTDPVELRPVAPPPSPAGTRDVSLSKAGESAGDFAT